MVSCLAGGMNAFQWRGKGVNGQQTQWLSALSCFSWQTMELLAFLRTIATVHQRTGTCCSVVEFRAGLANSRRLELGKQSLADLILDLLALLL